MAKNFEKLIFGGLHEKHAVQRGIWVPTQHFLGNTSTIALLVVRGDEKGTRYPWV
jgi:hypothetical protein